MESRGQATLMPALPLLAASRGQSSHGQSGPCLLSTPQKQPFTQDRGPQRGSGKRVLGPALGQCFGCLSAAATARRCPPCWAPGGSHHMPCPKPARLQPGTTRDPLVPSARCSRETADLQDGLPGPDRTKQNCQKESEPWGPSLLTGVSRPPSALTVYKVHGNDPEVTTPIAESPGNSPLNLM